MFNSKMAQRYCCEPIESIQGFKAASESSEKYHIHHKFEEMGLSIVDLKELGMYYNRPACELVFMNGREHIRMHSTRDLSEAYKHILWKPGHVPEFTETHRRHISEAKKGVPVSDEHRAKISESCKRTKQTIEYKTKITEILKKSWTPERRSKQSETTRRVWATNAEFRENLKKKSSEMIHRDLEEYRKYKSVGGELSWKPFRAWLAKQRKSK